MEGSCTGVTSKRQLDEIGGNVPKKKICSTRPSFSDSNLEACLSYSDTSELLNESEDQNLQSSGSSDESNDECEEELNDSFSSSDSIPFPPFDREPPLPIEMNGYNLPWELYVDSDLTQHGDNFDPYPRGIRIGYEVVHIGDLPDTEPEDNA